MNYDFGKEKTDYYSSTKEAYTYDKNNVILATMAEDVKNDLRKCHYTLGNDNLDYSTSNHMKDVSADELQNAKGKINEGTNPWKVNICLTHE